MMNESFKQFYFKLKMSFHERLHQAYNSAIDEIDIIYCKQYNTIIRRIERKLMNQANIYKKLQQINLPNPITYLTQKTFNFRKFC